MDTWSWFFPLTIHQKLFFWNKDGKLEMVEVDQSSYGIYVAFVSEGDQAMRRSALLEIEDSFYVNNKLGNEKDIEKDEYQCHQRKKKSDGY